MQADKSRVIVLNWSTILNNLGQKETPRHISTVQYSIQPRWTFLGNSERVSSQLLKADETTATAAETNPDIIFFFFSPLSSSFCSYLRDCRQAMMDGNLREIDWQPKSSHEYKWSSLREWERLLFFTGFLQDFMIPTTAMSTSSVYQNFCITPSGNFKEDGHIRHISRFALLLPHKV